MFDVPCAICNATITFKSQSKAGAVVSVARMIDDRRFWHGLDGVYEFARVRLRAGDSVCNDCLVKHKDEIAPALTVKCVDCGEMYQAINEREISRIGWGCACVAEDTADGLQVSGGWGSKYDCTRFKVQVPVVSAGDQVCDKCVEVFVDEGSFVEVK